MKYRRPTEIILSSSLNLQNSPACSNAIKMFASLKAAVQGYMKYPDNDANSSTSNLKSLPHLDALNKLTFGMKTLARHLS